MLLSKIPLIVNKASCKFTDGGFHRSIAGVEDEFVSRISRGSSEHVLLPFQSRKEFKIGDMVLSMQLIFWG